MGVFVSGLQTLSTIWKNNMVDEPACVDNRDRCIQRLVFATIVLLLLSHILDLHEDPGA